MSTILFPLTIKSFIYLLLLDTKTKHYAIFQFIPKKESQRYFKSSG